MTDPHVSKQFSSGNITSIKINDRGGGAVG